MIAVFCAPIWLPTTNSGWSKEMEELRAEMKREQEQPLRTLGRGWWGGHHKHCLRDARRLHMVLHRVFEGV